MKKESYNVAIAGATGAVGQEMIEILENRNFPVNELRLLASQRSVGKELEFKGEKIKIQKLDENSFKDIDIALFSAGGSRSREFAPIATKAGAIVVDNSSAFRMEEGVPLVVPEINPKAVAGYKNKGIVANPNCTTAVTVMALKPLHDLGNIKRVIASSYQAVSGAGAQAIEELKNQTIAWANSEEIQTETFPYQIAFNLLPQIDSFTDNGYTKEEMKLHNETRKILENDEIALTATTVRVPVFRAHSVSVNIETEKKISVEEAREAINNFPGVRVVDEPGELKYPMPIDVAGSDDCIVGRIREDYTVENGLSFWVVGDQLRKGAALNAVQIAELLIGDYI
ncbi:MAG: aspartate-semialdehyde dehydrogenase [Thermodesulfobacteriota bacterium]|nr:MAG: aspartate-semialdehyde dehydrogenase [Thermodesulfobacteriota bacterium]